MPPRGRKQSINEESIRLSLASIESNKSVLRITEEEGTYQAVGYSYDDRKKVHQYRYKRLIQRTQRPKSYVELCIKHGVSIASDNTYLKRIETSLLEKKLPPQEQEEQEEEQNNMARGASTRAKKNGGEDDEDYASDQDLLDELLHKDDGSSFRSPTRSTRTSSTPAKPVKSITLGATATLMDREKTVVPVDMVFEADLKTPWMNVANCLLSFIPEVKFQEGDTRYSMNVFELCVSVPDPRDANLRKVQLVDNGDAFLYTLEVIPQFNRDDPECLVTKAVKNDRTATWDWVVRCDAAQDRYKAMMTKLKDPVKGRKTMAIKFLLPSKATGDLLNPTSSNGVLDMDYNLVTHKIELDGKEITLQDLKLTWRAAIVSSIETITADDGVADITKALSDMMAAPARPTPRK
jgi:hypothetical protein